MRRKVTFLLAVSLTLLLLVAVCELPYVSLGRASAQSAAGASPQASGFQAQQEAGNAPELGGPLFLANCKALAEWGGQPGRATVTVAPARKTALRLVPIPGQLVRLGEYLFGTGPYRAKLAPDGAAAATRGKAPSILLGLAMALILMVVARSQRAVLQQEEAAAHGNCDGSPARVSQPLVRLNPQRKRPEPRSLAVHDQAAAWERVRLVPT